MEQILELIDTSVWNISDVIIGRFMLLRLFCRTSEEAAQLP